jgi:hypothetical protein
LTPEQIEFQSETHQLAIRSSYPAGLKSINSQELPESEGNFGASGISLPNRNASHAPLR